MLTSPLIAGPLVLALFATAGVLTYRQSRLDGIPDVGDPFDVEAVGAVDVDPADNASSDYEAACSLLVNHSEPPGDVLYKVTSEGWQTRTPKVEQWLRDNEPALDRWLIGTKRDVYVRTQPKDLTMESWSVSAGDLIAIDRLCGLQSAETESLGDLDGAWDWHRALFRHSRHIEMFTTSVGRMMGAGAHNMVVRRIVRWAGDRRLTSSQLAQALADVRQDFEMTPPPSVMIQAEYFVTLDQLNRLDEVADGYRKFNMTFGVTGRPFPGKSELFLNNEPELTKRLLRHQVANLLKFIDEPEERHPAWLSCPVAYYDQSPTASDRFAEPSEFQAAVDRSPLAQTLLMKRGAARDSILREAARQRLLETVLAAELYRREQSVFPESLDELVEANLLSDVPVDPTSTSLDLIRYVRDPQNRKRAKVWTVGQNGVDDGGVFEVIDGYGPADTGYVIGERDSEPLPE